MIVKEVIVIKINRKEDHKSLIKISSITINKYIKINKNKQINWIRV